MPRNNLRQAMVPRGADVLPNPHGSAPGLWLEAGARVVILLPGPPRELKPMFAALVEERLRPRTDGAGVFRSVLKVTGRIESQMDEQLQPLYGVWSARTPPVAATILAALGQIELHLSVRHASEPEARGLLAAATAEVVDVLGARRVQPGRPVARSRGRRAAGRATSAPSPRRSPALVAC